MERYIWEQGATTAEELKLHLKNTLNSNLMLLFFEKMKRISKRNNVLPRGIYLSTYYNALDDQYLYIELVPSLNEGDYYYVLETLKEGNYTFEKRFELGEEVSLFNELTELLV